MKRLGMGILFFIIFIFTQGNFGVRANEVEPLNCHAQSYSVWPPHDQLECRAPLGERIWPPSDYMDIPELNFYKFYKIGVDWHTANKVCEDDGAHLVIINSESESTLMKHLFTENKDVVGANGIDHLWMGIHERGVQGKYYTIFGDRVEDLGYIIPWGAGQPNDVALDDCASFITTGVLYDDGCTMKYPFVCEIERSAVEFVKDHPALHYVPETFCNGQRCHDQDGHRSIYWSDLNNPHTVNWSPRDYLVNCKGSGVEYSWPPNDYIVDLQLRSYYKVHPFGTNWFTALNTCEQEGAHLIAISSLAEAEATNGLMKKYPTVPGSVNSGHIWIGMHERGTHAQFVNTFGEPHDPQTFLVWSKSPPQPNDAGLDDCVSYHSTTTLYDDAWTLSYHFICEIEISAVESLRNSSKHKQIFCPVCNDRTCGGRNQRALLKKPILVEPTFKIDARSKPQARVTPKPSVGKKPAKIVAKPPNKPPSNVQSDRAFEQESEISSLIKSLVLKTNYTAPDLRCQHIPIDFNGGFCQSSGCAEQTGSCKDNKESALLHSMLNEIKAIKQQLVGRAPPTGGLLTFPGGVGRPPTPPKRKPQT